MANVFATLWDKVSSWFSKEAQQAEVFFSKEEQQIMTLLKPVFGAAEAAAVQDLVIFIRGVLTTAQGSKDLASWEAAVLNSLGVVGGELESIAKTLGSNVLQALIGLILAELPAPAAA